MVEGGALGVSKSVGSSGLSPSSFQFSRPRVKDEHTGDWSVSSAKRTVPVDRSQVSPEVLKAAQGMEAMFLDYLMKVMRETVPKNEMDLESPATQIYRGMMDSEVAQKAARHGGIGLAEQIIAYLESNRYHLTQGHQSGEKSDPHSVPKETS